MDLMFGRSFYRGLSEGARLEHSNKLRVSFIKQGKKNGKPK